MERAISALGVIVLMGVAFAMSRNRRAVDWRMVVSSLVLQFLFALLLLKTQVGRNFFITFGQLVDELMKFSNAGAAFVFGKLTEPNFGPGGWGFLFAFKVLPTIIFFASFMNVLYYLGIMQAVVAVIAKFIRKLLGTSGAETLCASANIFMGQTEAPLLIRPYIASLTLSELMVVMVSGFATLAAGVMFVYAGMLSAALPSAAGHLLAASVMSAPAAIMFAKILVPETEEPVTRGEIKIDLPVTESNVVEAAASGASTGLNLALNVGAMLIAFISLVALINGGLGLVQQFLVRIGAEGILAGLGPQGKLTLETIFGLLFSPVAWLIGVPSGDIRAVGEVLGQSLIINEFVAYTRLQELMAQMSPRAAVLAIYALCGFTNLSSIAIQIGGIGALAENRRSDLAKLGFLALFAATLANLQTAALAGILVGDEPMNRPAITVPATPAPEVTPSMTPAPTTSLSGTPTPTAEEPATPDVL